MHAKKKKEDEAYLALAILCSKCWKKYPLRECPLNNVEVCAIREKNHTTKDFPSFPELKVVYQGDNEEIE
jgi:hypothetical protein